MPHPGRLRVRRAGIDTYQQPVVYLRSDCDVCRAEGFESQAQVEVRANGRRLRAILHQVDGDWLGCDEIALSEAAWAFFSPAGGQEASVTHAPVLDSLAHLRAKVRGERFGYAALRELMQDIGQGNVSDIHLASFVTVCAGSGLDFDETVALTRAMLDAGERLEWDVSPIMDKHCIGGLPGNRTTLLVVPIVVACGVVMPKTSSRAITSASGTADAMETLAPVSLDLTAIRRVVEREGGCIAWSGCAHMSPADDMLIRVERPLILDSEGLMVASILSKKLAAGSQQVVIDIPVGPVTKVRSMAGAGELSRKLIAVGEALGLQVRTLFSDGAQPVGHGIGPALEAMDVLAVLEGRPQAPADLRERALRIAGEILEMAGKAPAATGIDMARQVLDDGRALAKFVRLCEAQGGMRMPPKAARTHVVTARAGGQVAAINPGLVTRMAKLVGAPRSQAAGASLHVRLAERVAAGQPLFTLHAQSEGELGYALSFLRSQPPVIRIEEPMS